MVFRPHLAGLSSLFSIRCACLLSALLFISCSSPHTSTPNASSTAAPGSPHIAPTVSTIATSLAPVTTPLAPPPQNCALKPPPEQKHLDSLGSNSDVQLLGGGVFWFYGMFYSSVQHLNELSFDRRWPMTKWVVEVGPNYTLPVTLRLRNTQTETLAWWTDGNSPPQAATQMLVLNPLTDTEDAGSVPGVPDIPHGPAAPGWSEWGLFPVFSAAGCYSLEVSWSGGSWQSMLAVGS